MGGKRRGKVVPKDLTPYEGKGLGELTEEEKDLIRNMPTDDALELAYAVIGEGAAALASQSNDHNAAARAIGFENAEHEVLDFIASDWFDLMIDAICASSDTPTGRSPAEYVQDVLDRAFDGAVAITECDDEEILRRTWEVPKGHKYASSLAEVAPAGTKLLEAYNRIIRVEQLPPLGLILELPGIQLGEAVCYGPEVRCA
jgi:hypothetical protein